MKILFINLPYYGHIVPTIGLVHELIKQSCEVTYLCPFDWEELIAESGAEFYGYKKHKLSIATEPFMLVSTPHAKRVEGFPLDCLSKDIKTGVYYYDLEEKEVSTNVEEGLRCFFEKVLV